MLLAHGIWDTSLAKAHGLTASASETGNYGQGQCSRRQDRLIISPMPRKIRQLSAGQDSLSNPCVAREATCCGCIALIPESASISPDTTETMLITTKSGKFAKPSLKFAPRRRLRHEGATQPDR